MKDYRNRKPPTFARPTIRSLFQDAPASFVVCAAMVWIGIAMVGYAAAVAFGMAW